MLEQIAASLREAGVFGPVHDSGDEVRAEAAGSKSAAWYFCRPGERGGLVIGLATADRWLSESIEADLMFRGDKLEELLGEELADQGVEAELTVAHFRDEARRYVFQSELPPTWLPADEAERVAWAVKALLAYEATFRPLGDMSDEREA